MPATLLVADDSHINRELVRYVLEKQGHRVHAAADGFEAVRLARELAPQLILMDWQMPVMGGLEATQLLKSDPSTAHIPVVALTAHALAGERDRALRAGCVDHLTKPVELARLIELVSAYCPT
jgi:CheY-like chemotaxis protein